MVGKKKGPKGKIVDTALVPQRYHVFLGEETTIEGASAMGVGERLP